MIKVRFFTLLKLYLGINELIIEAKVVKMKELIFLAREKTEKDFVHKLLNKDGTLKKGTIILINGKNILHLDGLESIINSGDDVDFFPPGGGG